MQWSITLVKQQLNFTDINPVRVSYPEDIKSNYMLIWTVSCILSLKLTIWTIDHVLHVCSFASMRYSETESVSCSCQCVVLHGILYLIWRFARPTFSGAFKRTLWTKISHIYFHFILKAITCVESQNIKFLNDGYKMIHLQIWNIFMWLKILYITLEIIILFHLYKCRHTCVSLK